MTETVSSRRTDHITTDLWVYYTVGQWSYSCKILINDYLFIMRRLKLYPADEEQLKLPQTPELTVLQASRGFTVKIMINDRKLMSN